MSAGDAAAFGTIYLQYFDLLYARTRDMVKDSDIAEDIVQEIFLRLWDRRAKFAGYEKISGWLFVCCYNSSLNYLKQLDRERQRITELGRLSGWMDEKEMAVQEQQFRLLEAAIDQLPPQRKKVFQLCKYDGLSYEQAAANLSISKNTVKEHLVKASAFIRDYVHQYSDNSLTIISLILLHEWL